MLVFDGRIITNVARNLLQDTVKVSFRGVVATPEIVMIVARNVSNVTALTQRRGEPSRGSPLAQTHIFDSCPDRGPRPPRGGARRRRRKRLEAAHRPGRRAAGGEQPADQTGCELPPRDRRRRRPHPRRPPARAARAPGIVRGPAGRRLPGNPRRDRGLRVRRRPDERVLRRQLWRQVQFTYETWASVGGGGGPRWLPSPSRTTGRRSSTRAWAPASARLRLAGRKAGAAGPLPYDQQR